MVTRCAEPMWEQLSLFEPAQEQPMKFPDLRVVGDIVGRLVLAECEEAMVTKVEGLPNCPFYRTSSGSCYSYEEGAASVDELRRRAAELLPQYQTVIPSGLERRLTVLYRPHNETEPPMWGQIGIYQGNMLFWKDAITYQFLEPYDNPKKLEAAYQKHWKELLENSGIITTEAPEHSMSRLYWSRHGFYASARYVQSNG